MAIQKDKPAPSPTEIKNTPHSFNEQELDQLKNLREKLSNLAFQFGQLQINKIKLEETETELKKELSVLEKEEENIAKTLSIKYGKGSINLDSGTFTPTE